MGKLIETGDMSDTAPQDLNGARFVGGEVDDEGHVLCPKCHKPLAECTCNNTEQDFRSADIPDDIQKARMGNAPPPDKKEEAMDFYDDLDTLLLEEFLPKREEKIEESRDLTPEEQKTVTTFTDKFHDYMARNGDRLDRKPSDVTLTPNQTYKYYYSDHFFPKGIR